DGRSELRAVARGSSWEFRDLAPRREERRVEQAPRHIDSAEAGLLEVAQVVGDRLQRLGLAVRLPLPATPARGLLADATAALLPVTGGAHVVEVEEPAARAQELVDIEVGAGEPVRDEVVEGARADDEVGGLDAGGPELPGRRDEERHAVDELGE